jgi:hypothetical protein
MGDGSLVCGDSGSFRRRGLVDFEEWRPGYRTVNTPVLD